MPSSSDGVKLLDRVRQAIRMRHYSRRTEEAYVYWIRRYIVFHGKKHPLDMGAVEISAFLTAGRRPAGERVDAEPGAQRPPVLAP